MSNPTQEILGPAHPRWPEFVNKLERAIVITKQPLEWRCDGDFRTTRQVLREMGAELNRTLAYFESCAAGCDCAVLQLAWEK